MLDKNGRTGELPFGAPLHLKEEPGTCASGSAEDTVHIDRGYENVVEKFSALGADIKRVKSFDNIKALKQA